MDRDDFLKLIGAESGDAEYLPVAFLLCNGYAAGRRIPFYAFNFVALNSEGSDASPNYSSG